MRFFLAAAQIWVVSFLTLCKVKFCPSIFDAHILTLNG